MVKNSYLGPGLGSSVLGLVGKTVQVLSGPTKKAKMALVALRYGSGSGSVWYGGCFYKSWYLGFVVVKRI